MEISEAQYRRIEPILPRQRGNVSMSNLTVLNAILYVAEQGCKWRGLPQRFGNWHTIYTRMNRWRAWQYGLAIALSTLPSDHASRRRPASLSLLLHQDVKGTSTPKLSIMRGVHRKGSRAGAFFIRLKVSKRLLNACQFYLDL